MSNKVKRKDIICAILLIFLLIIIIAIIIPLILGISLYIGINKNNTSLIEAANAYGIEGAKEDVSNYLKEKYDIEFSLELVSEGNKGHEITIDATTTTLGHDKKIKQYVFKAEYNSIQSYVTVWKNLETGEVEINEINGDISNRSDTSYKLALTRTNIKDQIDLLLKNKYNSYEIKYEDENNSYLKITIPEKVVTNVNQSAETIKNIADITKDSLLTTTVSFSDFSSRCFNESEIENVNDEILFLKSIYNYIDSKYNKKDYNLNYIGAYMLIIEFPHNYNSTESNTIKEVYKMFDEKNIKEGKNTYRSNFIVKYNGVEYYYDTSTESLKLKEQY